MNGETVGQMAQDIDAIKRLLVFALIRDGVSQGGIAAALGVNQSSVSRMFGRGGLPKQSFPTRSKKKEGADE